MMSGAGASEPGVTSLRLGDAAAGGEREPHARDVDVEVGFVCKKCRAAFALEAALLTHQRQCYAGAQQRERGAFRLVQPALECRLCGERARGPAELRRHADAAHPAPPPPPPPAESPLSHEMEDVVNQITLLAARAAQEADAGGAPRRFLGPEPLTSAGH